MCLAHDWQRLPAYAAQHSWQPSIRSSLVAACSSPAWVSESRRGWPCAAAGPHTAARLSQRRWCRTAHGSRQTCGHLRSSRGTTWRHSLEEGRADGGFCDYWHAVLSDIAKLQCQQTHSMGAVCPLAACTERDGSGHMHHVLQVAYRLCLSTPAGLTSLHDSHAYSACATTASAPTAGCSHQCPQRSGSGGGATPGPPRWQACLSCAPPAAWLCPPPPGRRPAPWRLLTRQ
jgi:hypothetical protein